MTYQDAKEQIGKTVRIDFDNIWGPQSRVGVIITVTAHQAIFMLLVDDEEDNEINIKLKDISKIENCL